MAMLRFSLLLLLHVAQGFKWIEKVKLPTLGNLRKRHTGSKFGKKQLAVITDTSSGLGKAAAKALLATGKYHVVGAVQDLEKMKIVAEEEGFDMKDFTPMHLDLGSYASVNNFAKQLDQLRGNRPIDKLACNAAVVQPSLDHPKWTDDGHEQQLQVNFLSQFLLISKVMPMMKDSNDPRIVIVGDNTVGGADVYPYADLKKLEGLELGCKKPIAMMDGYNFDGEKAYKDTKLALMMSSNMLHERFYRSTGIAFSSIYPGCIAESPVSGENHGWFKRYLPTSGDSVGAEGAGQRLFQVLHDPRCRKSGVYWGWDGEDKGAISENEQSDEVLDKDKMMKLWQCATDVTGANWPAAYQPKSPCPTLKVVGAATSILGVLEERARMRASRHGAGAKIVANRSLPKEERRKYMGQMLLELDKTPTDPEQLEFDKLRTSGMAPDTIAALMHERQLEKEAALAAAGTPAVEKKKTRGWLSWFRRKAKPVETLKDVTEEDLKAAFANENMKLAEQAASGVPSVALEKKEAKPSGISSNKVQLSDLTIPELDDPVQAAKKEPPKMIPGHELLGDIPVVFQPQNVKTMARVGQPLSEVASQADVFIRYKCRKGQCKTCVVKIDGKWVSACQTKIPPMAEGQSFDVGVRPVSEAHKTKETAVFFSPKSLVDGGVNNALGMVGFARDAFVADPDFKVRMERERLINEMTAKKQQQAQAKKATPSIRSPVKTPISLLVAQSFSSISAEISVAIALAFLSLTLIRLKRLRGVRMFVIGGQTPLMQS